MIHFFKGSLSGAYRSLSIETLLPTGGVGDESELGRLERPRWLRRLRVAGFVFGGLGAALFTALGLGTVAGRPALAGASLLVLMALVSILVVFVSRLSTRSLEARAVLISQAIADAPEAYLVVAPEDSIAYANLAFRRRFPEIRTWPLEAVARSVDGEASAGEFRRIHEEARAHGRANGRIAIRGNAGRRLVVCRLGDAGTTPSRLHIVALRGHHRARGHSAGDQGRRRVCRFSRYRLIRVLFA